MQDRRRAWTSGCRWPTGRCQTPGLPRLLCLCLFLGVGGQPWAARPAGGDCAAGLSVRVLKPAEAHSPHQGWWGTPTLPGVADEMWVHNRRDLTVPVTVEVHNALGGNWNAPDCELAVRLRVRSVDAGSGGADVRSVAGSRAHTREFVSAASELCTGSGSVVFHVPEADLLACRGTNASSRVSLWRDQGQFKRHERDVDARFSASCVNYLEGDLVAANGRAAGCGARDDDAKSQQPSDYTFMNVDTSGTLGPGRHAGSVSAFVAHQVLSAERLANVSHSLGTVCRRHLPEILHRELGGDPDGNGPPSVLQAVELGVAAGSFSHVLLESRHVRHLYSVDSWDGDVGGHPHNNDEYLEVLRNFRRFGERSTVMRAGFEDALYRLPDASLDLVYLDGNAHTGQEGGRTIEEWFAKVAPGGMLAGHDYDRVNWPLTYHNVNVFANRKGLAVGVTEACGDGAPSWFVIAPD